MTDDIRSEIEELLKHYSSRSMRQALGRGRKVSRAAYCNGHTFLRASEKDRWWWCDFGHRSSRSGFYSFFIHGGKIRPHHLRTILWVLPALYKLGLIDSRDRLNQLVVDVEREITEAEQHQELQLLKSQAQRLGYRVVEDTVE